MSEHEAVQLIFLPGFSTADTISDLSGRGVGMDVVRTAVARINGTVELAACGARARG
jgi:two-component system chemotaxis sensor kinase CheA